MPTVQRTRTAVMTAPRAKKVAPPASFAGGEAGNGSPSPPASPSLLPSQAWMDRAACKDMDLEIFFDEPMQGARHASKLTVQAKAICRGCPVREYCLDYGWFDPVGVFGGLTANERANVRRAQRRRRAR